MNDNEKLELFFSIIASKRAYMRNRLTLRNKETKMKETSSTEDMVRALDSVVPGANAYFEIGVLLHFVRSYNYFILLKVV